MNSEDLLAFKVTMQKVPVFFRKNEVKLVFEVGSISLQRNNRVDFYGKKLLVSAGLQFNDIHLHQEYEVSRCLAQN